MKGLKKIFSAPKVIESKVRILIADDDPNTLNLMKIHVDSLGWLGTYVTTASGIIDAVNNCKDKCEEFDAIIADINYFDNQPGPRLTGITAVREIRKIRPDVPVIFITGYSNSLIREEIRRVRAELMVKPFDFDKLFARVDELINWYRTGKEMTYTGKERRTASVNMTSHQRRASDRYIQPSSRITDVLQELRTGATK